VTQHLLRNAHAGPAQNEVMGYVLRVSEHYCAYQQAQAVWNAAVLHLNAQTLPGLSLLDIEVVALNVASVHRILELLRGLPVHSSSDHVIRVIVADLFLVLAHPGAGGLKICESLFTRHVVNMR
jgi:hypothetical protein